MTIFIRIILYRVGYREVFSGMVAPYFQIRQSVLIFSEPTMNKPLLYPRYHNLLLKLEYWFSFQGAILWLLGIIHEQMYIKRLLHDIFHIVPGISRDSHIKPDSEAGVLIWVGGWYKGRYGKCHVIIYLSQILHWLFSSNDFYIAEKIFEQTNCENKSLRELPLFNLQIFLFRVLYNNIRKCF